jgi:hypothetical protein
MTLSSRQWSVVSKKVFCFALSAMLVALCLPAEAQQPKVYRVGETRIRGRLLAELCEFSMADLQSKFLSLSGRLTFNEGGFYDRC